MNKLAIFDLDGVLCDLREVHFEALNGALIRHGRDPIGRDEHLRRFDGRPTWEKLRMLGVGEEHYRAINDDKQEQTRRLLPDHVRPNDFLRQMLSEARDAGYKLAVASNARKSTVDACLNLLGVTELFQWVVTPEGGIPPKPSPYMHLRLMMWASACPLTTVIFEDSPKGLAAAHASGAKVVQAECPLQPGMVALALAEERQPLRYQWPELNVLIPAAGRGQRFRDAGYDTTKPFIRINGKQMVCHVIDNLAVEATRFAVFSGASLPAGLNLFQIGQLVGEWSRVELTRGTAETCLFALKGRDLSAPLLIANSDQLLEWDHLAFYHLCRNTHLDAVTVVFDAPDRNPKWSYCKTNPDGTVWRVAEKDPISDVANCGVYFFKRGSDFVKYAEMMIAQGVTVNGEYYVAPVLDAMIADGKAVGTFRADKMHGLGTPDDLEAYLAHKGWAS